MTLLGAQGYGKMLGVRTWSQPGAGLVRCVSEPAQVITSGTHETLSKVFHTKSWYVKGSLDELGMLKCRTPIRSGLRRGTLEGVGWDCS